MNEVSCFFLRLKGNAASISAQDAARQLAEISNRLGIPVHADINDIETIAHPYTNPEDLATSWMHANETGSKICFA